MRKLFTRRRFFPARKLEIESESTASLDSSPNSSPDADPGSEPVHKKQTMERSTVAKPRRRSIRNLFRRKSVQGSDASGLSKTGTTGTAISELEVEPEPDTSPEYTPDLITTLESTPKFILEDDPQITNVAPVPELSTAATPGVPKPEPEIESKILNLETKDSDTKPVPELSTASTPRVPKPEPEIEPKILNLEITDSDTKPTLLQEKCRCCFGGEESVKEGAII